MLYKYMLKVLRIVFPVSEIMWIAMNSTERSLLHAHSEVSEVTSTWGNSSFSVSSCLNIVQANYTYRLIYLTRHLLSESVSLPCTRNTSCYLALRNQSFMRGSKVSVFLRGETGKKMVNSGRQRFVIRSWADVSMLNQLFTLFSTATAESHNTGCPKSIFTTSITTGKYYLSCKKIHQIYTLPRTIILQQTFGVVAHFCLIK